jgi:hypothetical protein
MSASLPIRIKSETQRTITAATIAGSPGVYLGIGTAFANPIRIFYLFNQTDALLQFSWDGINDNFVLPSEGFILLDITSNKTLPAGGFYLAEGDRVYVKTLGTPTVGSVYLSSFYGSNG